MGKALSGRKRNKKNRKKRRQPKPDGTGEPQPDSDLEQQKIKIDRGQLSITRIKVVGTLLLAALALVLVDLPKAQERATTAVVSKGFPIFDEDVEFGVSCWNHYRDTNQSVSIGCLRAAIKKSHGRQKYVLQAQLHIELEEFKKAERKAREGLREFPGSRELERLRDQARGAQSSREDVPLPSDPPIRPLTTQASAPTKRDKGELHSEGGVVVLAAGDTVVAGGLRGSLERTVAALTRNDVRQPRPPASLTSALRRLRDFRWNVPLISIGTVATDRDSVVLFRAIGGGIYLLDHRFLETARSVDPQAPPDFFLERHTVTSFPRRPVSNVDLLERGRNRILAFGSNRGGVQLGLPPLQYAESDAEAMSREMSRLGFLSGFSGSAFRAKNLIRTLTHEVSHSQPGDSLVVFYSGHAYVDGDGGVRLMTADPEFGRSPVHLGELTRLLADHRGDVTVVIDGCMNARPGVSVGATLVPGLTSNLQLLFAASPGEQAIESIDDEHGLFTSYLLDALRDAQPGQRLDWESIFRLAGPETFEAAAEYEHQQRPILVKLAPNATPDS